jgi:hypothetical protein
MSNTVATSIRAQQESTNGACRARAHAFLVELVGNRPHTLTWDSTHCLQGHVHIGCRELVVIAARDAAHNPVVLTTPSWDAVRRSPGAQRRELLASCTITDRAHLVYVLESDEQMLWAPAAAIAA